jgi:hypothetical protein
MMLATSLPPDIPASEICAVYRLRWQIELAFKRLKSLIRIDRIPTQTEAGGLSWLYPHLILALLTDDICQESWTLSPLDCADDAGVPSIWSVQAVVIDLLRAALMPPNFNWVNLARNPKGDCRLLAEAKRKRQRQRIFATKSLT